MIISVFSTSSIKLRLEHIHLGISELPDFTFIITEGTNIQTRKALQGN